MHDLRLVLSYSSSGQTWSVDCRVELDVSFGMKADCPRDTDKTHTKLELLLHSVTQV